MSLKDAVIKIAEKVDKNEERITRLEKITTSNSKDIARLEMEKRNLEIKLELANGEKVSDLSVKYKLGKSRISQIKNS